MGINLAPDFLSPGYLAAWDAVLAPVHGADRHAAEAARGGRATVARHPAAGPRVGRPPRAPRGRHRRRGLIGLGGDLDGISFMPAGVSGVESYPLIPEALAAAGLNAGTGGEGVLGEYGAGVRGGVGLAGNWKLEARSKMEKMMLALDEVTRVYHDSRIHYCPAGGGGV